MAYTPYSVSGNVRVFPSTYRTDYPNGKFTSENNFVNIINSLTDNGKQIGLPTDGYVIDYVQDKQLFKFVIHGYYFEVENLISGVSSIPSTGLFAHIRVNTNSNSLVNYDDSTPALDVSNQFTGVYFDDRSTSTSKQGTTVYTLLLAENKGGLISIPNKVRFVTDSVEYVSDINSVEHSLTDELDIKQYKLTAGNGIKKIENFQSKTNTVELTDDVWNAVSSISGDKTNVGSSKNFVYVSGGKVVKTDASVGSLGATSGGVISSTSMIMTGGEMKNGVTVYAASRAPMDTDKANIGDIWLRYE